MHVFIFVTEDSKLEIVGTLLEAVPLIFVGTAPILGRLTCEVLNFTVQKHLASLAGLKILPFQLRIKVLTTMWL